MARRSTDSSRRAPRRQRTSTGDTRPSPAVLNINRLAGNRATVDFVQRYGPPDIDGAGGPQSESTTVHSALVKKRRAQLDRYLPGREMSDGEIIHGNVAPMGAAGVRQALAQAAADRSGVETLLSAGEISRLISAPSDPQLAEGVNSVVASAQRLGLWSQLDVVTGAVPDLIRRAEVVFILDPERSSLDLLPAGKRGEFTDFEWGKYDFPGGEKGAHEGKARRLGRALAAIRTERRVHTGDFAIVRKKEFHKVQAHIRGNLKRIPQPEEELGWPADAVQPAGPRLYEAAKEDFVNMRAAAAADGVPLIVLAGWRSAETSKKNAAKAGNSVAVADWSAHNLGLAVDLKMGVLGHKIGGKEVSTRPFGKVVRMRSSAAHKWLFLRGAEFGWYPYRHEPWHWEYNPEGFKETFWQAVDGGAENG